MLIEKSVKDRFVLSDWLSCTSAATTKQVLLTATRPMKLRIRDLKFAARASQNTVNFTTGAVCLVLVQAGYTAGSVFVPTAAGVDDLYEPASNLIWNDVWIVLDANAGTGPGTRHNQWNGDGLIINMMVGDSIQWCGKTDEAIGQLLRIHLDIDILS